MLFKFGQPEFHYRKEKLVNVTPGTVFCNACHNPEKIINGNEKVGIYMKVDAKGIENYYNSQQMLASGYFKNKTLKLTNDDVRNSWAISLKNGDLYNFAKDGKDLECWIMNAEMSLNLVKSY